MTHTHLRTLATALGLAALLGGGTLRAQESAYEVSHQDFAKMPGDARNLSIVDGDIYCYASGVLLRAQRSGGYLLGLWADTTLAPLGYEAEYLVRQPGTGDLFFTLSDADGLSRLYRFVPNKRGGGKARQEKMGGMSVEHPTFTPDGQIMVFASRDKKAGAFGGYDLWYSRLEKGRWSRPQNLGGRINTKGDELSPSISGGTLFFSSNGQAERTEGKGPAGSSLDIYATRLLSDQVDGDTVGMLPIGRSRVQLLPSPINAPDADDCEFWCDTAQQRSFWITTRDKGSFHIYSFNGPLDGVMLWGRVTDQLDHPLAEVAVSAMQQGVVLCRTTTLGDGSYTLHLQANQQYELGFSLANHFTSLQTVDTRKADDEFLFTEMNLDVSLDRLPLGKPIYFNDLYDNNADATLSQRGARTLEPLLRYLRDNPRTAAELTLYCDHTRDAGFNRMLTERRLRALEQTILQQVPASVQLKLKNGCAGRESCSDGTLRTYLVVVLAQGATD